MQTVDHVPATEKTPAPRSPSVMRPPSESNRHRIYVWSSPSPYALVIDEARSFQPR